MLADAPMLSQTQQSISGHRAKHLVAALAAWPLVHGVGVALHHAEAPVQIKLVAVLGQAARGAHGRSGGAGQGTPCRPQASGAGPQRSEFFNAVVKARRLKRAAGGTNWAAS